MDTRVVIVHTLDQAEAAVAAGVELGVPLTLRSAPAAGAYLGAGLTLNGSGRLLTLEASADISAVAGAGYEGYLKVLFDQ